MAQTFWTKLLDFDESNEFGFPNLTTIKVALEDYDCSSLPLALIPLAHGVEYLKITGGRTNDTVLCEEQGCACLGVIGEAHYSSLLRLRTMVIHGDLTDTDEPSFLLRWVAARACVWDLTLRIGGSGHHALEEEEDWLQDMLVTDVLQRLDIRLGGSTFEDVLLCIGVNDEEEYAALDTLIVDAPQVQDSATERLDVSERCTTC